MQSTDATAGVVAAPRPERAARLAAVAFAVVLLAVEAVIVAESWRGLTGFAHLIGIRGPAAWGVPVTLDGVSLIAALVALRAELAGEASGIYRVTLFGFTAASAAANYGHGTARAALDAAMTGSAEPELLPEIPSNGVLAAMPKAQAIRIALAHNDDGVLAAQAWLAERGIDADRAYMHDVKRGYRGKGRRHKPEPPARRIGAA